MLIDNQWRDRPCVIYVSIEKPAFNGICLKN